MIYNYQYQVLIGTILGGSSLVKPPKGKNYYLSMRSKDKQWLQYKMALMPDFFVNTTIHQYGKTYRCNSCCANSLTELHHKMYSKNKRAISMEILDSLRDIALAIWFLDGGSKTGRSRKNAYINTTKFGKNGTKIITQYFNEVGMNCNVNKDGTRLKTLFSVDGTEEFFKTIACHFPTFLEGRLI